MTNRASALSPSVRFSRPGSRWWSTAIGSSARSVVRILPVSTAASRPLPQTSPNTARDPSPSAVTTGWTS
ncbi:hypothetical protein DV36_44690 [Amycolatopsis mediterranei]|nr:hypothetical protein DV36_44690 [Amycolatopsis mediterranei]